MILTETELTHVPHLAKSRVSAVPQNSCCDSNLSIQGKDRGKHNSYFLIIRKLEAI